MQTRAATYVVQNGEYVENATMNFFKMHNSVLFIPQLYSGLGGEFKKAPYQFSLCSFLKCRN